MLRTGAVIICSLLLFVTLFGGNAVLAVDRGPLNPDHVSDSLAEAGVYEHAEETIAEMIAEEFGDEELEGIDVPLDSVIADVLDAELIERQVDRNIHRVYAYLAGESSELVILLDTDQLEAESERALAEEFEELDYAELGYERLEEIMEDEETYERERLEIRADVLEEFGVNPDDGFGNPSLAAMIADEESYQAEREDIHADVADDVLEEADADRGFGYERLENLLASESSYEAEREEFREERKQEIQDETDRELSDEQLEEEFEERADEYLDEVGEEAASELDFEDFPDGFDAPVEEFAELTAEGLVTDMPYGEFRDRYDTEQDALRDDLIAYIGTSGYELHDDIHEEVDVALPDEAPETVEDEADRLQELVIDAITTEMAYDDFAAEYEVIANDIEEEATDYAWENREDYDDEIEGAFADEREDVPAPIADEIDQFEEIALEAVLTDLPYDAFIQEVEAVEASIVDAIVAYVFEEEDAIPREIELSNQIESEAGDELDLVQMAISSVGSVALGLFLVSMVLVGGVFAISRNVATTGIAVGLVGSLVGGVSFASATLLPAWVAEFFGDFDVPAELHGILQDLLASLLWPWAVQSIALVVGSVILLALSSAVRLGYLDLTELVGTGDAEEETEPE